MADNRKKSEKGKKNKAKPLIILAIVVVLAIAAVGVTLAATGGEKKKKTVTSTPAGETTESHEDWGNRLVYKGKNYRRNENLSTILFLGVDKEYEDQDWEKYEDAESGVMGNAGRADTIILFILDDETQTTRMLSISRNSMTDVDMYDMKGNYKYSVPYQINMQYAFGDSPSKSLFLTKRTVGELLYNIRIDGALALTLDGIRDVVDRLGGIELTMPEDYSYIDERYTEGTTITLNGAEMEHFIRYRGKEMGANEERVRRTSWIIQAVFQELKAKGAMSFIEQIIDSHPDYITSDCEGELLKKLSKYQIEDEKYTVPGETVKGGVYDEYHVDDEALQELIVDLLYVPVEEEAESQSNGST